MNWSEFLSRGGYAFYVWGSYGLALLVMGGEVILVLRRKKALLESARQAAANKGKVSK